MNANISIESKDLERFIRNSERGFSLAVVMGEIAQIIESSIVENFSSGGRYGNGVLGGGPQKWQPSKRALLEGGKTLMDTGNLRASVVVSHSDKGIMISTARVDAPTHHYGDKRMIYPFGNVNADKVQATFPARPFLVVQDEDITEMENVIINNLSRILGI